MFGEKTLIKIKSCLPNTVSKKLPNKILVKTMLKREMSRFNRLYRKKIKAANVLSFSYGKDYGEILVCPEVIRKEAKAAGNSYKYQMTWMILHGMLHLGGIHHEKSLATSKKTEKIEQNVLKKIFE